MRELRQDRLHELICYEPETGKMFWRVARGNRASGAEAGCDSDNGYRKLRIDGQEHYLHRVVFLYITGKFPAADTDHINGDRQDNRWSNLRAVSRSENLKNAKIPITNKSGVMGVFWNADKKKWTAKIKVHQRDIHLGHFNSKNAAAVARLAAQARYGFHENHGRCE